MAKRAKSKTELDFDDFQKNLAVEIAAEYDAALRPFRVDWLHQRRGFPASVYAAQQSIRRDGFRFLQKSRDANRQYAARRSLHNLADRGFVKLESANVRGFSIRPELSFFEVGRSLAELPGVAVAVRTLRKIVRAMKTGDVGVVDFLSDYSTPDEYNWTAESVDWDLGIAYELDWLRWHPDTRGVVSFEPTPAGRAALQKPPRATRGLPSGSKHFFDLYFDTFHRRRRDIRECVGEFDKSELGIIPSPAIDAVTAFKDLPVSMQTQLRKRCGCNACKTKLKKRGVKNHGKRN